MDEPDEAELRAHAAAIARSRAVAAPRWSPDGARVAWIESAGDRTDVVVAPADGSAPGLAVTADVRLRTPRATDGGTFCWAGPDHLALADADGRLLVVPVHGGPSRVLSDSGRAAAPAATPDGTRIAFVLDREDACEVVVVPASGETGPVRRSGGADYAWDPAWSPDGELLAWHEWDLTGMSWDASRVVVAPGDAAEGRGVRVVAGGPDVSVGQPRFSPTGDALAWVTDESGWWNVVVAGLDGAGARPLLAEPREHAEPAWGPGQRSFAWSPDGRAVALSRNEDGFGRLVAVPTGGGAPADLAKGWHHALDWGPAGIVAVRSGARTPPTVTLTAPDGGRRALASGGPVGLDVAGLVEPEPITWAGEDGAIVHGLWYPPAPGSAAPGSAPADARPPLLVDVHGGPTGQATVGWHPDVHLFTTRGWAVLAPDFRGSTGHGRAYTQALAGRWGELDVSDVASGIRHVVAQGRCDERRVGIVGGSAGGLTALLVCARHPDLVRAAVVQYAVTDLAALADPSTTTDRFESRYLDRLVGPLPAAADLYRDRSPVTQAARIGAPLLVLQGDADEVVPAAQATALVAAVRTAGGTVEHHVYEGEGHGWSRPATKEDAMVRTEAFLRRWVLEGPR